MSRLKSKPDEKRRRVALAMRPDIHDKLRALAAKQNLSMSRLVELLVLAHK